MKSSILLIMVILIIACKREDNPFNIYDSNGNIEKQIFKKDGRIDSMTIFKGDTILKLKGNSENSFRSKIFIKERLFATGEGKLSNGKLIKSGWWKIYNKDTTYYNEYKIIKKVEFVNQSKVFYNGKLVPDKSFYFNIYSKQSNQDSDTLIFKLFTPYPKENESKISLLCLANDANMDFTNLDQIKIDTLLPHNTSNQWEILVYKKSYKKKYISGFFYTIEYLKRDNNKSNVVIKKKGKHYFRVKR